MSAQLHHPVNRFGPLRFCRFDTPTDEGRRRLILRAAYLRAERRNFPPGHELEDWLAAETEIDNHVG